MAWHGVRTLSDCQNGLEVLVTEFPGFVPAVSCWRRRLEADHGSRLPWHVPVQFWPGIELAVLVQAGDCLVGKLPDPPTEEQFR